MELEFAHVCLFVCICFNQAIRYEGELDLVGQHLFFVIVHSGQFLNGYSKSFSQSLNIQSLNIVIFEYSKA
jgi:hypothetical protein